MQLIWGWNICLSKIIQYDKFTLYYVNDYCEVDDKLEIKLDSEETVKVVKH